MDTNKYQVLAEDEDGDQWMLGTDQQETADHIAEKFRGDGLKNVRIVEN